MLDVRELLMLLSLLAGWRKECAIDCEQADFQDENAIKFDPNNESAWSYKTNLLLEASKLAEMDGKTDQKAQLQKDYEAALKRTTELSVANQKRKEEEEKSKASPKG